MESNFVSYELALRLNGLGFNDPCLANYVSGTYGFEKVVNTLEIWNDEDVEILHSKIKAPLWQQAWEFLLSKLDANIFFWGDGVGEIGGCGNQQFFRSWEESIDILIMLLESTIKK